MVWIGLHARRGGDRLGIPRLRVGPTWRSRTSSPPISRPNSNAGATPVRGARVPLPRGVEEKSEFGECTSSSDPVSWSPSAHSHYPGTQRNSRTDDITVRDLSSSRSRPRQLLGLGKGSFVGCATELEPDRGGRAAVSDDPPDFAGSCQSQRWRLNALYRAMEVRSIRASARGYPTRQSQFRHVVEVHAVDPCRPGWARTGSPPTRRSS